SKRDCQILTSLAPSSLPPNQAARNRPGSASTIVEAWHEANGAFSKINMGWSSAPHLPQPQGAGSVAGQGPAAVRRKGHAQHVRLMPLEAVQLAAIFQ